MKAGSSTAEQGSQSLYRATLAADFITRDDTMTESRSLTNLEFALVQRWCWSPAMILALPAGDRKLLAETVHALNARDAAVRAKGV